ncbi:hypothetical protein F4806DRAFT_357787 [Annulohypoxylon nitens]|nr:hypothetical protein F4806DRAFT_357787 [Annulohypoxylon nitens]
MNTGYFEDPYSWGRTAPFPPGLEQWREFQQPGTPSTRGNRGAATPNATLGGGILPDIMPAPANHIRDSDIPPMPFRGSYFAGQFGQLANASPTWTMLTQRPPATDNAGLGPLRTPRAPSPRVVPLPDEHRSYDASDEASYASFSDLGSVSHSDGMDTDEAADADNVEEVAEAEDVEEDDSLADIPPIAFTTTGELLLLGEEFIVPTAEEAHREAGPRVGPGRVISRQETVDEHGRRTSVIIDEMVDDMDVTMSGARQ